MLLKMNDESYVELDDPLDQVRRTRAELLEEYGGFDGYVKHVREDLAQERLEKAGFRFASPKARQCAAMA